ncbi:ABC transporter permease [Pantoea sp. App145]|uniref:ABC transporter permease n=1 Tax=Pantoea sp. App145 TaxID=3071567 RepID=UPI003A80BC5F
MSESPSLRLSQSAWLRVLHQLIKKPGSLMGLLLLVVIVIAAVLAPWIAPQNPYDLSQLDITDGRLAPGAESLSGMTFWLGSDDQGRDMLSAILYGTRISLWIGFCSSLLALLIGTVFGILSAWNGGRIDAFIMRIVDIQLSFPPILIALILLTLFGQGADKIILALVLTQWAYYTRAVRGNAMVEMRRNYIAAAHTLALGRRRIMFRHLLPNCLSSLIVVATLRVAYAIMLEATLSFLGIGLPVTQPSLGLLIANGFDYLLSGNYWISLFPGIVLLLLIIAINLLGDALRDITNPQRES